MRQYPSNLEVEVAGIRMRTPLMAVSGVFGKGYERLTPGLPYLGSAVMKSITLEPRIGNSNPRIVETPAGMLNAIGLHNPGVHEFIHKDLPKLRTLDIPIIASVAGVAISQYVECCRLLANTDEIEAIELNVSCPNVENGVQFGCDADLLEELVASVRDVTTGVPLIVKLTPNVTDIVHPTRAAVNGGANAISLINTLHGMTIDLGSMKPSLGNRVGGLSGIAIHPVAVYMVHRCYVHCCKEYGIPIIGIGGVSDWEKAVELILAGATCVGIGTAMFRDSKVFESVAKGINNYLQDKGNLSMQDIIGRAAIE